MWKKTEKGEKTGTNIAKAYSTIHESMQIEKINNATAFSETQHIVILFSDGTDLSVFTYNLVYICICISSFIILHSV